MFSLSQRNPNTVSTMAASETEVPVSEMTFSASALAELRAGTVRKERS